MTAITASYPRRSPNLLLILLAGIAFLVVLASAHALLNHGSAAIDAQRCFSGGGTVMPQIMADPLTGRTMEFCKTPDGRWYISINGRDGGNVTMFPRSFAKCLRDVLEYAKRSGFTFEVPTYIP